MNHKVSLIKFSLVLSMVAASALAVAGPPKDTAEFDLCEVMGLVQDQHISKFSEKEIELKISEALKKAVKVLGGQRGVTINVSSGKDCAVIYQDILKISKSIKVSVDVLLDHFLSQFVSSLDKYSQFIFGSNENAESIPNDQYQLIEGQFKSVGYARFFKFQEDTADAFIETALHWQRHDFAQGLIIDLRDNIGGSLEEALDLLEAFISDEVLLKIRNRDFVYSVIRRNKKSIHLPLVVWVNNQSKSAAEAFAGVIQSSGRGDILGQATFGKSMMQQPHNLKHLWSDHMRILRLTTAEYILPNNISVEEIGVTPDYVIDKSELRMFGKKSYQSLFRKK